MISTDNTSQLALDIELSPEDACVTLINLIDEKINKCKLDHLSAWVKDHNIDSTEKELKINALNAKKDELLSLMETENYKGIKLQLKN